MWAKFLWIVIPLPWAFCKLFPPSFVLPVLIYVKQRPHNSDSNLQQTSILNCLFTKHAVNVDFLTQDVQLLLIKLLVNIHGPKLVKNTFQAIFVLCSNLLAAQNISTCKYFANGNGHSECTYVWRNASEASNSGVLHENILSPKGHVIYQDIELMRLFQTNDKWGINILFWAIEMLRFC